MEVICESRGPNNLAPSRSRLFKLIGKGKVICGAAASDYHIWWLTYAKESEKRRQSTIVKL